MLKFKAKNAADGWAPRIDTACPFCNRTIMFYTTLYNNQCTLCRNFMPTTPNLAAIAKSIEARKLHYVIDVDTEG